MKKEVQVSDPAMFTALEKKVSVCSPVRRGCQDRSLMGGSFRRGRFLPG